MSGSSPDDLAIAFRALPRRLKEAQGDVPSEVTASAHLEVDRLLQGAARLLHSSAEPVAVADAITQLPAKEWDASTLERLREIAIELGGLVRRISTLADGR